ncbi:MAG TPA: Maf family protein [Pseudomonadales bacterium]|nr:Maf family protein [Pseudomonadales bacterium]
MTTPLWLASTSPRRRALLQQIGVAFQVLAGVEVDETPLSGEPPADYVTRLALAKARAGLALQPDGIILGADTTVVQANQLLGKPRDLADAEAILQRLSGQKHQVLTAVAIVSQAQALHCCVATDVWFRALSREEILAYWQTGEPQDKAGAYGIQGFGGVFVERIDGSYSAVVGLPIAETATLLKQFAVPIWSVR